MPSKIFSRYMNSFPRGGGLSFGKPILLALNTTGGFAFAMILFFAPCAMAQAVGLVVTTANLGANQVTLQITSASGGTGYITLLQGVGATCGTAAQTAAGQDSTGAAAFRQGSLNLTAGTAGTYTFRNLLQTSSYTACVTDGTVTPVSSAFTTSAAINLGTAGAWTAVGQTGVSANYVSLAFAPDSTPYLAEAGSTAVLQYTNGSWTAVGTGATGSLFPSSLVFAGNGTPYLASTVNGKPNVAMYDGSTWTSIGQPLQSDPSPQVNSPSFALAPDATPYFAFYAGVLSDPSYFVPDEAIALMYSGSTWGTLPPLRFQGALLPAVNTNGPAFAALLTIAPDGTAYFAYSIIGGQTILLTYNTATQEWDTAATGFASDGSILEALAFGPDNTLYLAFADASQGAAATVIKYDPVNGSTTVGSPGFTGPDVGLFSMAFGPDGSPYLAYIDPNNSWAVNVVKYNSATNSWIAVGSTVPGSIVAGDAKTVSLAIAPNGTPYLAYVDSSNNNAVIVLAFIQAPVATTVAAVGVTGTTAVLNATVTTNNSPTTVSFEYGTSSSYGVTLPASSAGGTPGDALPAGTGTVTASANIAVFPNTTYHFRVDAINGTGTTNGQDMTFTTGKGTPAVTVTTSNASVAYGTAVTLTATLSSAITSIPATGAVTFSDGATTLGSCTLAGDTCSINTSAVPAGTYTITAMYGGDANFAAASGTASQTVTQVTPSVLAKTSNGSAVYGTSVTFTAKLSPAAATGTVSFSAGAVSLGSCTLASGSCSVASSTLTAGSGQTIVSTYSGDANFATASGSVSQTITQAMPTVTWSTPAPIAYGTALSATQLDAVLSVSGGCIYSPSAGTVLSVGAQKLTANCAPADTTDYATPASATVQLTVNAVIPPVPIVSGLTPAFVTAGGSGLTLTVTGANLPSDSTVYWGATALTTTYVSGTQLKAAVPASMTASAGIDTVSVVSPTAGSSNLLQFAVTTSDLTAAPTFTATSATVTAGNTASYSVTVPASVSNVSVVCLNLPAGVGCSYSPGTLSIAMSSGMPAGNYTVTVVLEETVVTTTTTAGWLALPFIVLPLWKSRKRLGKRAGWTVFCVVFAFIAVMSMSSCGGSTRTITNTETTSLYANSVTLVVK